MFPYADNLTGRFPSPLVSLLIVVMLGTVVADYLLGLHQLMLSRFGFVPVLFSTHPWLSAHRLVTASFVHADIFHVAGNCLFLWVFGRSLERLVGWPLFAILFPFLGVAGFLVQWLMMPASPVPIIGASGAIAFLLGAYLVLLPEARMRVAIVWLPLWKRVTMPAWGFMGVWIALQFLSLASDRGQTDSVAYAVHVGSFAAGLLGAAIWKTSVPLAEERLVEFVRRSVVTRSSDS